MAIHISELTDLDYKLLKYINKFESVSKEKIVHKFKNKIDSIDLRLTNLSFENDPISLLPDADHCYILEDTSSCSDGLGTSTITYLNSYHITPYGKKVLQDYLFNKRNKSRTIWLKNAWIPIIVAFITTLLTNYIIPKLPKLIKWFYHILSKIVS